MEIFSSLLLNKMPALWKKNYTLIYITKLEEIASKGPMLA